MSIFDDWDDEIVEIVSTDKDIINAEEAERYGKMIVGYFKTFNDITDYFVVRKLEKVHGVHETFNGFGQYEKLFSDSSLEPKDLDISIEIVESRMEARLWQDLAQITASFPIENMPGRVTKFLVRENTTDTVLGMLRLGSPTLNMKPRNEFFKSVINPKQINDCFVNGTVIVPAQPFGFNALGGKLMALICTSNEVKDIINQKYGTDIKVFETTSLYGSIKNTSQYDGLRPFIRYGGDTESKFPMNLNDHLHHKIKGYFDEKDRTFSDIKTGSVKLKIYMKMIGTIKRVLKNENSPYLDEFLEGLTHSQSLTTQKRYYYCDYGVENIRDVIIDNAEVKYKTGMSPEKFDLDNIIGWWKNKAQKRYNKLKESGNLREELEYWTESRLLNKEIDMIR